MRVVLHHLAEKYYMRLNASDRGRIEAVVKGLEKEPPEGDIVPYKGTRGTFRLKTGGGFRLLFTVEESMIKVTYIERRGQAYAKKTKKKRG